MFCEKTQGLFVEIHKPFLSIFAIYQKLQKILIFFLTFGK